MLIRIVTILSVMLIMASAATAAPRLPSFLAKRSKTYTPYYFFKVKGSDESQVIEKTVKQIEKELGVRVERLDALADAKAQALLMALPSTSAAAKAPCLYHRESMQIVDAEQANDISHVRAWAKGRYLPPRRTSSSGPQFKFEEGEQMEAMADAEELMDAALTPEQKSGKDAIKRRTEEMANDWKN